MCRSRRRRERGAVSLSLHFLLRFVSRGLAPASVRLLCLQTDWGGQRTLQRKWTSFLKARMVCSVPEYELHLNVLRSVFVLQGRDAHSSVFYGIFGLEW